LVTLHRGIERFLREFKLHQQQALPAKHQQQ